MQKGSIGVTTENIFPVIKKFLYSDHEIFLRELVSNAVDATQKLKTLSSFGEYKGELGDMDVTVTVNKDERTLTVTDRGTRTMPTPSSATLAWAFTRPLWYPRRCASVRSHTRMAPKLSNGCATVRPNTPWSPPTKLTAAPR